MSAVVYRFYSATPELLYVGVSANFGQRLTGHNSRAPWFSDTRTVTIEHFATAQDAKAAEREAIVTERPLHNINLAPAAVKKAHRARREDRSKWPAEGLLLNRDFLDDFLRVRGLSYHNLNVNQDWLMQVLAGRAVDLVEAEVLALDLSVSVAALFPNHNPMWTVVDGRFVPTKSLA